MREVVIIDAVRSPIGRAGGALSSVRPDNLLADVLKGLIKRTGIDLAAAVLLMNRDKADELGLIPMARWTGSAVAGVNPGVMGYGCSGARILTTLIHEMKKRNTKYGLATLCVGVGQGVTTLVEGL